MLPSLEEYFPPDGDRCITPSAIEQFYINNIKKQNYPSKLIVPLELNQYLEKYLWPLYEDKNIDNIAHIMSIIVIVNQKFKERVSAWDCFSQDEGKFPRFFRNVCRAALSSKKILTMKERTMILIFLIWCFNSVEIDLIRGVIQKYASFAIWTCLSDCKREQQFKRVPKLKNYWNALKRKDAKMDEAELKENEFERQFLSSMIKQFTGFLNLIPSIEELSELDKSQMNIVSYCERFLEFLIDLEALLPTRRFFNAVLDDSHAIIMCRKSALARRPIEGRLFCQLLDILIFYLRFEIDDFTGEPLTTQEMTKQHYDKMAALQLVAFKHFPEELKSFYLKNISSVDTKDSIIKHLKCLPDEKLIKFTKLINLDSVLALDKFDSSMALESIALSYERIPSQLDALNQMPLYPTEEIIWDENLVPNQYFDYESCLALPKLNLQFLTLHDYLLRNFKLFRLESTYEIRQDIEQSVSRMKPWRREDGEVMFGGWSRMAVPIESFVVIEVGKPNIGERAPCRVRADVKVVLSFPRDVKAEWDSLRKHDVCFLISVAPTKPPGTTYKQKEPFLPQVGLRYVRGCEIQGILDTKGELIDETSERPIFDTDCRTYRVWLDPNQYYIDTIDLETKTEDVYDSFNILLRKKPKENNFKAVLETIRDLMNTECVVPKWLHDVILGYGDPSAAHYSNMPNTLESMDFKDTFISYEHLQKSFPGYIMKCDQIRETGEARDPQPPFRLSFDENSKSIEVTPYVQPNLGPYPSTIPKKNTIRFTPTQIEAIKSGMQPGLTMVVGPPGTGKTDVAVQIISNLYNNFPEQRTVIVTHSNQALNQLFEKIMHLDIDERHLLRLGHGEEELDTDKDFSRYGRVNYVLKKRLELLDEVNRLASSLEVTSDVGYTCETACYFFLYHISSRWTQFTEKVEASTDKEPSTISKLFPFSKFFSDAPEPLFKGQSFEENYEIAKGCYRHLRRIFSRLEEFRAFEMLRTGSDRSQYLLLREAKIIAMTCTHAALKRRELVEIGFQYDNILMEESAQILEIETFVPLLLQNPEHGHNRLKRWIMIGDHHQLPPVIKNMAFQKYSNMEQSLFTRLVRLGVSTIDLDAQGRSRPSLCSLYRWRYKNLSDLPHVLEMDKENPLNPGFRYDYQIINVEDFDGVGESEPQPYFYQNLAEAEYAVALFMYMRVIGYPNEKITILTTYNGQKHLIREVLKQRCGHLDFIGRPDRITTVDKFQGSQNDYIILSLVRSKAVGHLRDVRRLVVAMSRARLGLYIFGRVNLFKNCIELRKSFDLLLQRPTDLNLHPEERFPESLEPWNRGIPTVISDIQFFLRFVYDMLPVSAETAAPGRNQSNQEDECDFEIPDDADQEVVSGEDEFYSG